MTKKICKVVFNSVSHDARVLKEAEALREAGYLVTIIGIQDANNDIAAELLEDGVFIRRAAWRAGAFKPLPAIYWARFLLVAVVAGAVIWGVNWLIPRAPDWWTGIEIDWGMALPAASILVFLAIVTRFGRTHFTEYARLRKGHLSLRKKEKEALLRYDAVLRSAAAGPAPDRPAPDRPALASLRGAASEAAPAKASAARSPEAPVAWKARLPRPLMNGLRESLKPKSLKKWKVVFARENAVYDLLREEAPDIVHAHDISALPVCARYKRKTGAKLVFDAHEVYDHLAQAEDEMAELNGAILQKYAGQVDLFVTINDSIGRYYANNYPGFPKAVIVKNATKQAEPFTYDGRLHEAAGLPPERRILLYQGGFAAKRGLAPLLLSAEHLSPDWRLVFMGWGRFEDELRHLAEALKVRTRSEEDPVIFVPKVKQKELPYWTAGAAAGVIPYENTSLNHWYCTPNKLWEYPNAGVPILVSPFPEMQAVVERYGVGWLLPDPLTPSGIAAAVNQLTEEDLQAARENCRHYIDADNWSVYARRLTAAYGEQS